MRQLRGKMCLKVVCSWVTGAAIALTLAGAYGQIHYGSVRGLVLALQGNGLLVTPDQFDLGELEFGEPRDLMLCLSNISQHPITVTGCRTSCSCVTTSKLPLTLTGGEKGEITLAVRAAARTRRATQTITLYVAGQESSEIQIAANFLVSEASLERVRRSASR